MVKMKLRVPYFKQEKMTCVPSSLQQVLAYYGKKAELKDMLKLFPMYEDGTYEPYAGLYAMKLGFKPTLFFYNLKYMDPTWLKLGKKQFLKKLKTAIKISHKKDIKRCLKSLIEYIQAGGKIKFQIPSRNLLIKYLKKNVPIMISLYSTILHNKKRYDFKKDKPSEYGELTGHMVVIGGFKNGKFFVIDPSSKYGGRYWVEENKLIFSWLFYGGWTLVIEG